MTVDELQTLMVTALTGNTIAMASVYAPRDWPTKDDKFPLILLQAPREVKTSLGPNGAQQFTTVGIFPLIARLTADAGEDVDPDQGNVDGKTAGVVLAALSAFKIQIERALINSYALTRAIQHMPQITAQMDVDQEGEKHIGELSIEFHLEFYQGPEDFFPIDGDPLTEFKLYADLVNLRDPNRSYETELGAEDGTEMGRETEEGDTRIDEEDETRITDDVFVTPFPDAIETGPGTVGPDGRSEAILIIELPQ